MKFLSIPQSPEYLWNIQLILHAKELIGSINQRHVCFTNTLFTQPSQSARNRNFSARFQRLCFTNERHAAPETPAYISTIMIFQWHTRTLGIINEKTLEMGRRLQVEQESRNLSGTFCQLCTFLFLNFKFNSTLPFRAVTSKWRTSFVPDCITYFSIEQSFVLHHFITPWNQFSPAAARRVSRDRGSRYFPEKNRRRSRIRGQTGRTIAEETRAYDKTAW